ALRRGDGHRETLVATDSNFRKKRNFTEQRNILARSLGFAAAVAENFNSLTSRCCEITHVFDNPKDWHINLLEHSDSFSHHTERSLLRRCYDHPAVQRNRLAKRKLRIAGAWRQI